MADKAPQPNQRQRCYFCGSKYHLKSYCPKRKRERKNKILANQNNHVVMIKLLEREEAAKTKENKANKAKREKRHAEPAQPENVQIGDKEKEGGAK